MATTMNATRTEVTDIGEQFLAMVPVRNLKFMNSDIFKEKCDLYMQLTILEKTVLSPVAKKYPPSLSYRKMFLKTLLKKFEASGMEVCDEMYEEFTKLMAMADTDVEDCYRTYTLPNKDTITMKESTKLISHGTTGLQTWPAALCLAEWAMENKQLMTGKRILELGCGLGLTGLIICRTCTPTQYVFTDCHQQVLRTLQENIEINRTQQDRERDCFVSTNNFEIPESGLSEKGQSSPGEPTNCGCSCKSCKDDCHCKEETDKLCCNSEEMKRRKEGKVDCHVVMETLDWENVEDEVIQDLQADVILAADVVYDTSIVPSLVGVLCRLLSNTKQEGRCPPVAYITSTIRNEETYQCFLQVLGEHNIVQRDLNLPSHQVFYYDKSCPIKLLQLSL